MSEPAPKRGSRAGWITAIITVSGSIICQLLQVRASDAEKMQYVEAGVSMSSRFDRLDDKFDKLSERVTAIEVQRLQEAQAAAQPVPLIKGKKK